MSMIMNLATIIPEAVLARADTLALIVSAAVAMLCLWEWRTGRYRGGRKSRQDWAMWGLSATGVMLVQRPFLMLTTFLLMMALFPDWNGALRGVELESFWPCLIGFILIDELLHGAGHRFAHTRTPRSRWLAKVQRFYRIAHRPHHLIGGNDGRGELSATQTIVEHWGWWFILPNYWFGMICLYLGFYETFFWGMLLKTLWGHHVHTNWGNSYDLYLLNHRNRYVRNGMYALCHVITFPNMHHHHHSRGTNSARNLHNMISLWDWLLWGTLAIEKSRPEIYGWKQKPAEERSALHRYFYTPLNENG